MTPLEELRHSASHILATALLRLYPEAKLDIGPLTDTGSIMTSTSTTS